MVQSGLLVDKEAGQGGFLWTDVALRRELFEVIVSLVGGRGADVLK